MTLGDPEIYLTTWQNQILQASIQPGNKVYSVLERNDFHEDIDTRHSSLLAVNDKNQLVLEQTHPPVSRENVGKQLEITFLVRVRKGEHDQVIRTGYQTQLREIILRFKSVPGDREQGLIVEAPKEVEETNLRIHRRVVAPTGVIVSMTPQDPGKIVSEDIDDLARTMKDQLWAENKPPKEILKDWNDWAKEIIVKASRSKRPLKAALLDLSQGGAKLIHPTGLILPRECPMLINLHWGNHVLELDAEVVRAGSMFTRGATERLYTSVKFLGTNSETRDHLKRLLVTMARSGYDPATIIYK